MAIHPLWTDDYWLLIVQLYQKSPAGVKSEYSRPMVDLALELHIPPKTLQEQMVALEEHATPSLQRLWDTYAENPRRLARDVKRLRQMAGLRLRQRLLQRHGYDAALRARLSAYRHRTEADAGDAHHHPQPLLPADDEH